MKKSIIISIEIVAIVGIGIWLFANLGNKPNTADNQSAASSNNVTMQADKQIIEVNAKGGYSPRLTTAKANVPTILRIKTNSTFDCSSALRIPALNYAKNLPPSGTTDIELTSQQASGTLKALCSMGMYSFSIEFKG